MIKHRSFNAAIKQIAKSLVGTEYNEIGHLTNRDEPFQAAANEPLKPMKILQSFI
jgi:hypothetical protein